MENLHMDYATIMNLWMYDFQNILERYGKMIEERKEDEKKQNEEFEKSYPIPSPDKYLKGYGSNFPKIPNMNNVKL
jgi:hypothetical protein